MTADLLYARTERAFSVAIRHLGRVEDKEGQSI